MLNKTKKFYFSMVIFIILGLILAACSGSAPAPAEEEAPAQTQSETSSSDTEAEAEPEPTDTPVPPTPEPEPPAKGGELVYGHNPEPDTLDPAASFSSWNQIEMRAIYDTLVWWGPDKGFHPGLAESWEISDDGKTYTFNLRQDVTFHDGTPFNAEAVKVTFDRIGVDEATVGKGAAGLMGSYESTEVVDDFTVNVNFCRPISCFFEFRQRSFPLYYFAYRPRNAWR